MNNLIVDANYSASPQYVKTTVCLYSHVVRKKISLIINKCVANIYLKN